ncbi:hypothetical protein MJH12_08685 [bacterium]|nr:hypothetical protein [bacterium]
MMIFNAKSSLLHWIQRVDATDINLSISYWQISRCYSLVNNGSEALHYVKECLEISKDGKISAFYLIYAYEAMAFAYLVDGNHDL